LYLSVLTLGELRKGIDALPEGTRRHADPLRSDGRPRGGRVPHEPTLSLSRRMGTAACTAKA